MVNAGVFFGVFFGLGLVSGLSLGILFGLELIIGSVLSIPPAISWILAFFAGVFLLHILKKVSRRVSDLPGNWFFLMSFSAGMFIGGVLLFLMYGSALEYPWHLKFLWTVATPTLFLVGAGIYEIYWQIWRRLKWKKLAKRI